MMRSDSEIKLLKIRQNLRDALASIRKANVVSLREYQALRVDFEVCRELIAENRREQFLTSNTQTRKEKA